MSQATFRNHYFLNASWRETRNLGKLRSAVDARIPEQVCQRAQRIIKKWDCYAPTPTENLSALAKQSGLSAVFCKDEGKRFGLGSFKALGGAYAVAEVAGNRSDDMIVSCATEGNHGRSVAWGAQRVGIRCKIFLHENVSTSREAAIAKYGAEIVRTAGDYDDAVRECARVSAENGWLVVSDTTWDGYQEIPRSVMAGYSMIAAELQEQLSSPPTHVFLQAGVGGFAAAMIAGLSRNWPTAPLKFIIVEPQDAACLLASARAGGRHTSIKGPFNTISAGLACGEPSAAILDVIYEGAAMLVAVDDDALKNAMRLYGKPYGADPAIVSGASGAAGLAGLTEVLGNARLRSALDLGQDSRVLLINTENDTDPQGYREVMTEA